MRWLLLLLLLSASASAAIIQGTVYDFSLTPTNAIVEVDTVPRQVMVALNGRYEFNVPEGAYTLSAEAQDQFIEENITVSYDGKFILDLILLPDLDFEEALLDSTDSDFPEIDVEDNRKANWLWIVPVLFIILAVYFVFKKRKKPEKLDSPSEQILQFIEKQGGRTTQKEIYKSLPWSESKISLILDDLESNKFIRKVKKGRSNLIFRK